MHLIVPFLSRLFLEKDERGQTLVEYGLIIALVDLAAIVALTAVGTNLTVIFNKIVNQLS